MSKFTSGRALGIGFAVFAVICLVVSWDYGRGRVAVTNSPVIAEAIAQGAGRNCGVDVTDVMTRQFPVGMARAEAEAKLAAAYIVPPRPWFWTPVMLDRTDLKADTIRAIRTVRTSAFGPINLQVDLTFADGKVTGAKGQVTCAFGSN
jgi:hypothetical protein